MKEAFVCLLFITVASMKPVPAINDRPVIGILSLDVHPWEDFPISANYTTYMAASYVKWAEMGGSRVVPLKLSDSIETLTGLVSKLNGVIFTGGTSNFFKDGSSIFFTGNETSPLTTYAQKGCAIFDQIVDMNKKGTYMPLWTTCLGYELANVCVRPINTTIGDFDGEPPYTHKLTFEKHAENSKIFTYLGHDWGKMTLKQYADEPLALFSHHHGVAPETYTSYPVLSEFYQMLATSRDHAYTEYIALIEAYDYPIYGSQFHPEKNIYEWNATAINHDQDAVEVSTYLSQFFINEARKNNNTFGSDEALKPYLIYNYDPIYIDGYFVTIYAFN